MSDLIAELKSSDASKVCAAIEALELVNPDAIKQQIVPLLLNQSVLVRSRAARSMCRWDKTEAIRYLAAMLFSKNKAERDSTLNNSLFFPFKQIEAILLKFLTVENEPELIKKAGIVFMANPDKSTAFRLYEAQQATRNLRSDMINGILMGVLNSLFQAQLEKDPPLIQLKNIQKEYENRRIKTYINHFSSLLGSEEPDIRLKAALKLCELIKHNIPDINFLIIEYLKTEPDENVANKVKQYLDSVSQKVSTTVEIENADTPENRKKIYASINKDNYLKYINILLPELKKIDPTEQVIIIKFVQEYGDKSQSEYIIKCMDSKNPEVIQAAIETLCKIDQEKLQPLLPNLIKSDSDQIKLSAINAFALFEKKQALTLLSQMMTSVKAAQRKNALFCLENLDFASASEILIPAFKHEKNKEIREELCNVLYDNANSEIFCEIYFQYMNSNGEEKKELKKFLDKIAEKLSLQNIGKKTTDYWNDAKKRWDEENAVIAQREAYRLENIQNIHKDADEKKEKIELIKFGAIAHSIGFVLSLLIWFIHLAPYSLTNTIKKARIKAQIQEQKEKKALEKKQKEESIPTEPITIKGTIIDISKENKQAMLVDSNGKSYLLQFSEGDNLPEKGGDITAQVMVEDIENSVYTAEVINLL